MNSPPLLTLHLPPPPRKRVRLKSKRESLPMALRAFCGRIGEIVEELEMFELNPSYFRVLVRWGDQERVVAAAHLEEVIDAPAAAAAAAEILRAKVRKP